MSPQKVREVTREVQGMPVSKALALLAYTPKKAAMLIGRTLQSAIANAVNNNGMDEETLFIKSCTATDGGQLKRIMPRARGSASPIIKRMAHITVIVASMSNGSEENAKTVADATVIDADSPAPKAKKVAKKAAKKTTDAAPAAKRASKAKDSE
jgi:large subunit ribosomal protein L22